MIVLALGHVPSIDATGFVALESAISRLCTLHKVVILSGPLPEPRTVFVRANLPKHFQDLHFTDTLAEGLALAQRLAAERGAPAAQPSRPPPTLPGGPVTSS